MPPKIFGPSQIFGLATLLVYHRNVPHTTSDISNSQRKRYNSIPAKTPIPLPIRTHSGTRADCEIFQSKSNPYPKNLNPTRVARSLENFSRTFCFSKIRSVPDEAFGGHEAQLFEGPHHFNKNQCRAVSP